MPWTVERKRAAATYAPLDLPTHREDTRVVRGPGWYQLITPSAPGTLLNEVVLSRLGPSEVDRGIDEVVATYHADGHPVKWCVGHWTEPADFAERLRRRGFSSWGVRGMVVETSRAPRTPDGVDVVAVDESSLDDYLDVAMRGWSIPSEQSGAERVVHLAALRGPPDVASFFMARVAGEIVGTTSMFTKGDHGYLAGTQVLPGHRGRGFYRAMVAARLEALSRRGIELAVTQARDATSAPILARLGFETVFRSTCLRLDPPS